MRKMITCCLLMCTHLVYANEMLPIPVEAQHVTVSQIEDSLQTIGTLEATQSVQIRPEISGRIAVYHFNEGEHVDAGTLLISLEDSLYVAELAMADAKVFQAENNFKRAETLLSKGTGSASDHDTALAEVKSAKAARQLAVAKLDQTKIKAPFSGVMGIKRVTAGNYVQAGEFLVNLENLDALLVYFKIPEVYLKDLHVGAALNVQTDAYTEKNFSAMVAAIDPKVDLKGRNLLVKATLDNKDHMLRPGMFVNLILSLQTKEDACMIPETAIFSDKNGKYVFQIKDGKAAKTIITTGKRQKGMVEVKSGLNKDDNIIISGHLRIQDGSAVAPVTK